MSKAAISALVVFGILFLLIGYLTENNGLFLLGLLMIGGGLYAGLGPDGILRKEVSIQVFKVFLF
jgi:hypothetical protein